MRFEHQPLGDTMVAHPRDGHRREERPGTQYIDQYRLLHTEPAWAGWWRSIATAMSVVKEHAIESFASCAVAMHPELFYQASEQINRRDPAEVPPLGQRAGGRHQSTVLRLREETIGAEHGAAMRAPIARSRERQPDMNGLLNLEGFTRLETARTGYPDRQAWIMSIPANLWSRMLRAHRTRQARAALEVLDDRMLRDIGVARHEIGQIVKHGRRRS